MAISPGILFDYLNQALESGQKGMDRGDAHLSNDIDLELRKYMNPNWGINQIELSDIDTGFNYENYESPKQSYDSMTGTGKDIGSAANYNNVSLNPGDTYDINSPKNFNTSAVQDNTSFNIDANQSSPDNFYTKESSDWNTGATNAFNEYTTPGESAIPRYSYESDMPLNKQMFSDNVAKRYSDATGIPYELAQQRVNRFGGITDEYFQNKIEPTQKNVANQIMDILGNRSFKSPQEYNDFMNKSGLLQIAMNIGPYGEYLQQYGPKLDLSGLMEDPNMGYDIMGME